MNFSGLHHAAMPTGFTKQTLSSCNCWLYAYKLTGYRGGRVAVSGKSLIAETLGFRKTLQIWIVINLAIVKSFRFLLTKSGLWAAVCHLLIGTSLPHSWALFLKVSYFLLKFVFGSNFLQGLGYQGLGGMIGDERLRSLFIFLSVLIYL